MATFLINTAGVSQPGTSADDFFIVESGAFGASLQGLGANDDFDFTNFSDGYIYGNGSANGNLGDDTFSVELATAASIIGSFFGGGQGNDDLSFVTRSSNDSKFIGNLIQGGEGNDTIYFSADQQIGFIINNTINGNGGNDLITVSAAVSGDGKISNLFVGGGQGTDVINVNLSAYTDGIQGVIVNGGLGSDEINFQVYYTSNGVNINGGTYGTQVSEDLSDNIFVSSYNMDNSTIGGNNGNDVIKINVAGNTSTNVLINGNAGDDVISLTSGNTTWQRSTIAGGDGNDLIEVESAGQFAGGGNFIRGGIGEDTITFETATTSNSLADGFTIEGGAGADLVYAFEEGTAGRIIAGGNFGYASLSDSTFAASDTIQIGSAGTAGYNTFALTLPGPVDVVGNGTLGSTNLDFTAGVLVSSMGLTLGQLVAQLDANLAEGEAAAFCMSAGAGDSGYVFVKGATDNLFVEFSEAGAGAFSANAAQLNKGAANRLDLDLA